MPPRIVSARKEEVPADEGIGGGRDGAAKLSVRGSALRESTTKNGAGMLRLGVGRR